MNYGLQISLLGRSKSKLAISTIQNSIPSIRSGAMTTFWSRYLILSYVILASNFRHFFLCPVVFYQVIKILSMLLFLSLSRSQLYLNSFLWSLSHIWHCLLFWMLYKVVLNPIILWTCTKFYQFLRNRYSRGAFVISCWFNGLWHALTRVALEGTWQHRGERRGLGGIFFDDLNDREAEKILAFSTGTFNCLCVGCRLTV